MSSFDSLAPNPTAASQAEQGRATAGFTELCPAEEAETPIRRAWRPLCAGPEAAGADVQPPPAAETRAADDAAVPLEDPQEDHSPAFAAGYELGRQETRAQIEEIARELTRALEAVSEFSERIRSDYERELLSIALAVARKIVRTEVTERPETWLPMIREAVLQAVDRRQVSVRVSGKLATFLREQMSDIRTRLEEVKNIEVVEDPALAEGDCIIETRLADLDASIDSQVYQVARALTESE